MSDDDPIDAPRDDRAQAARVRLMAFVDGEGDADERARFEAAMADDPTLAAEVAAERVLRARLHHAYAPVLDEAVPGRFAALMAPPPAEATDLAAHRARRAATSRRRAPGFALAAALALLAVALWSLRPPSSAVRMQDGALVAGDGLAASLDRELASAPEAGARVSIGLTFRDDAGAICRSFSLRDGSGLAGLACRSGNAWRVEVLARGETAAGDVRQAAADMPAAVQAGIDARLRGDAFDAAAERTARDADWR